MFNEMTVRELIDELEDVAEMYGDDTPVKAATQPNWPFQNAVGDVVVADDSDEPDINEIAENPVCFIPIGEQECYLPKWAKTFLRAYANGWDDVK